MSTPRDETVLPAPLATWSIVRGATPKLLRDGVGPLLIFLVGWKLIGLGVGIGSAALFGLTVYLYERRNGQPGVMVRLALVLVAVRATVGLSSGSATVYLAQEIGIDTLLGCAVLLSLGSHRPFASWFSEDIYPLPAPVRESRPYAQAMRRITVVWGAYFLARAAVRLAALLTLSTDGYVLVAALSDAPFLIALLAWSVYRTTAALRHSAQWGPVTAVADAPPRRRHGG